MCLQLPPTSSMKNFEGDAGSTAMAALAEKLEELGMKNVDKARLTARIPVIKFYCPIHAEKEDNIEDQTVEQRQGTVENNPSAPLSSGTVPCDCSLCSTPTKHN